MKTLTDHLSQYAAYHQDSRNVATHFTIDPEATMATARSIDAEPGAWEYLKGNADFMRLLRLVFTENDFPSLPNHPLRLHGSGMRHTTGLSTFGSDWMDVLDAFRKSGAL